MARSKNKEVIRVVEEMKKADIRIMDSRLIFIFIYFLFGETRVSVIRQECRQTLARIRVSQT